MFPRIVVIASGPRRAGPTYGLILRQSIRQRSRKLHKEICLFAFSNMWPLQSGATAHLSA